MAVSESTTLEPDLEIRIITAPYFVATKLEAFKGRGNGDFFGSHDLEDIVAIVDGRASIMDEVQGQTTNLRKYIGSEIAQLLGTPGFVDALPGHLLPDTVSQARISVILRRLRELAAIQS